MVGNQKSGWWGFITNSNAGSIFVMFAQTPFGIPFHLQNENIVHSNGRKRNFIKILCWEGDKNTYGLNKVAGVSIWLSVIMHKGNCRRLLEYRKFPPEIWEYERCKGPKIKIRGPGATLPDLVKRNRLHLEWVAKLILPLYRHFKIQKNYSSLSPLTQTIYSPYMEMCCWPSPIFFLKWYYWHLESEMVQFT